MSIFLFSTALLADGDEIANKIGFAVGVVIGVAVVLGGFWYFVKSRRR
jgi:hypothetical protein